jgi:hypothetical protein
VGTGKVHFRNSQLVLIVFDVAAGTPLEDVITDISKELGGTVPTLSLETKQNGFGTTLQERKAFWSVKNLSVAASEMRDFEYGDMGISVVAADSDYFKQKEVEREAARGSTIR